MTGLRPFTVPHFREWTSHLVLDSGDPWKLEPFQAAFARDLFRGYQASWLVIPEGNAKTTLAAALALYHAGFKADASVTVAAASRDQAHWLYLAADGFVRRSELRGFKCQEGFRRIRVDSMGSRIQIFAADDRTGDGAMPTLAILEELHRHRTLKLYRTWRGKIEKRHGQIIAISTAGEPEEDFEASRQRMRAEATETTTKAGFTRAATKDYVLHEYAVPEGKDPENMRDVKLANPLKTITVTTLARKHRDPTMTTGHWLRFSCGLPAGMDEQPITPEEWDRLRVDIGRIEDGEDVMLAPSIGGNAAIAVAAHRPGDRVAVRVFHVEPEKGRSIQKLVEQRIVELCDRYSVVEIHHPTAGFVRLFEDLEDRSLPIVQAHPSPSRLVAASGTFDQLLKEGTLTHDGDPKTRGQVLAATKKVTETGERYIPGDGSRAIGAIVMAVHAVTAYSPTPVIFTPSGVG